MHNQGWRLEKKQKMIGEKLLNNIFEEERTKN